MRKSSKRRALAAAIEAFGKGEMATVRYIVRERTAGGAAWVPPAGAFSLIPPFPVTPSVRYAPTLGSGPPPHAATLTPRATFPGGFGALCNDPVPIVHLSGSH